MKKHMLILLLIFMPALLTACGRGGDTERPDPYDILAHIRRGVAGEEPGDAPTSYTVQPPMVGSAVQSGGTLRVLAPVQYRSILNAARSAINLEMGVDVEITTFNPENRAEYWASRLPEAIENGEFDLFFTDPRYPIFEMAQAGLLVDFFELINFCSHTAISDFYIEPLHALTVDNRLYMFPLNFGFQYVAINTYWISQRFVDRFNSYETITVSQMMDIYLDIAANYTILLDIEFNEGGQVVRWETTLEPTPGPITLNLANCRDLLYPEFMVWNALMDYVDLNSRTSNLLDSGFVNFLQQLMGLFPHLEHIEDISPTQRIRHNITPRYFYAQNGLVRVYVPIWLHSELEWETLHYLFVVQNQFLNPVTALVPFRKDLGYELTHFSHFIPLVDEMERLRTNIGTTFPSGTVSIANNSNASLAWDFISRYLIPASICPEINETPVSVPNMSGRLNSGLHTVNSPIERSAASAHLPYIFTIPKVCWQQGAFCAVRDIWIPGVPLEGIQEATPEVQEQTIARVVAQLQEMNEMQMVPVPLIPFELFELPLQSMLHRFASPEGTAQIIHNNVVEWMRTND